ncbi:uncharacterized protein LOC34619275 [Cyclospora cayetanensis]|uniref:Uncharacterized protein LOC34619275 n=1 Tax=Cyclospora cayetanensis TaxID=88456 RepID=A0A6P6RYA5_9EIME|nr:uncharacterized protein LOC34619275 [Cyclospora cayetanensis]
MEMPNDGVALEGRLVEAEDDGGKSFKGSDRMPSSLHLSTQAASSSVFEEDGDAREGQQNKELKKFEDVQVYLVCPSTAAWAAAAACIHHSDNSCSTSTSAASAASAGGGATSDDTLLQACQWLVKSGCIRTVEWKSPLVLQGELLHFGVVLIPQDGSAAAAGSPTAARAWLRKYASLSAALDLVLRDGSSRIKAAGQSALSCQFWEAQAFPIDSQEAVSVRIMHFMYSPETATETRAEAAAEAATITAAAAATAPTCQGIRNGGKLPRASGATHSCIICDVKIPMRISAAMTNSVELQSSPGALFGVSPLLPPRASAADGSSSVSSGSSTTAPSAAASDAPDSGSLLTPAPGSAAAAQDLEEDRVLHISTRLTVQRPLQVTTALMDSFMYVQIENSTDSIPVVVENAILRSVNSNAQGDLPVTLYPQEQHSVLLRLDESFLSYGVPQWGGGSGTECSRGSVGPSGGGKAVLPLCLKW